MKPLINDDGQCSRNIEQYTKDYLKSEFEPVLVHYRRKKVLEYLNQYSPKNILEVGCGVQSLFDFYTDYETFTVIEPSPEFCKSIKKSAYFNNKITIIPDFLENAVSKLKGQYFDFILVSGLLHEVVKPSVLLQAVHQICNENTIVHINVPNSESFHLLWAYESNIIPGLNQLTETAKKLQQNTVFNLEGLEKLCNEAGFCVLKKETCFLKPFNHKKMSECIKNGLIDQQLLEGLYGIIKYFPRNGTEIFINCKAN
jgi:2-polyprenyl-3-methyl-5-hydroxy-6-metoxy-1,4-benzoquinol methylase